MDPGSLNFYAYCKGNPVNYVDPSRHCPDSECNCGAPPPSIWVEIEGSFSRDEEEFQNYVDRSGQRDMYERKNKKKALENIKKRYVSQKMIYFMRTGIMKDIRMMHIMESMFPKRY